MIAKLREPHEKGKHVERETMRKYRIDKDLMRLLNDTKKPSSPSIHVR